MNAKDFRPRLLPLAALCAATLMGAAQAAEVTIYKQPNFSGGALTLKDSANNLATSGFHDQASSIEVRSGRWEFCSQPDFRGDCVTLDAGKYATLDQKINHRVESVREVTRYADNDRAKAYNPNDRDNRYGDDRTRYGVDRYADNNRRGSRFNDYGSGVEIYATSSMRGRGVRVKRDIDTFADTGLEGRISALVIHEGSWQVCTRPGYEGQCRVLEPGTYDDLGRFDNRIGSMRRVG
jgi:hypothetical protein